MDDKKHPAELLADRIARPFPVSGPDADRAADMLRTIPALEAELAALKAQAAQPTYTYASTQATTCAQCGEHKHTPLRIDAMDGYVCLTCIDKKLGSLLGEFGYPEPQAAQPLTDEQKDAARYRWLKAQHEVDDDEASDNNYGKTYPRRTATVFIDDGEDGLEPLQCDPGALDDYIDAAIAHGIGKEPKS